MIKSDGKNVFPGDRFSFWEWSAPILQKPEEVIHKAYELHLADRIVKDICAVGIGYNWTEHGIDESICNAFERMHPLLRKTIPDPESFLPKGVELPCLAEIDEPLWILFEDGDTLCISFDEGSSARMELNSIPLSVYPGKNARSFHAGRLFHDMIGKRITGLEVTASTEYPDFTGSHGLTLPEQLGYISRIDILYDDASGCLPRRRLSFTAVDDYGWVELIDHTGRTIGIPTEQVPWVVDGFIAPDILKK